MSNADVHMHAKIQHIPMHQCALGQDTVHDKLITHRNPNGFAQDDDVVTAQ